MTLAKVGLYLERTKTSRTLNGISGSTSSGRSHLGILDILHFVNSQNGIVSR